MLALYSHEAAEARTPDCISGHQPMTRVAQAHPGHQIALRLPIPLGLQPPGRHLLGLLRMPLQMESSLLHGSFPASVLAPPRWAGR